MSLADLNLGVPRQQDAAFVSPERERSDVRQPTMSTSSDEPDEPDAAGEPDEPGESAGEEKTAAGRPPPRQRAAAPDPGPDVGSAAGGDATAQPSSVIGDDAPDVHADVVLGTNAASPQFGILGETAGRAVAVDLNETHTISLFGVQGGGKSYTLGTIAEMATLPIPGVNRLPRPLATVIFHYSQTQDYAPEFTTMACPNDAPADVDTLRDMFDATPAGAPDIVLLTPEDQVGRRRAEYPDLEVRPLMFNAAELGSTHWRSLMGAVGNQAMYVRQLNQIMRDRRDDLSVAAVRAGVDDSRLPDHVKELAHQRLQLANAYIDDRARPLGELIRPGRLVIVDLRDEFIEKDEALGLFVVLLQLCADAREYGATFNKLVVFDEAHKYIDSPDLASGLVQVVREMRHKGTSVLVASQDPPSVPISLIELSTQVILHRFNSPAWLKHIQKANAALRNLTMDRLTQLAAGEAYVWSSKATDEAFTTQAIRIKCRPRVTQHGGQTRRAVD